MNQKTVTETYTKAVGTTPAKLVVQSHEGRTMTTEFNALGRPTKMTLGSNPAQTPSTAPVPVEFGYDTRGRLARVKQVDGSVTRETVLTYHATKGVVETITDPLGRVTTYEPDRVGRVKKITFPDLREMSFEYDLDGNLKRVVPPGRTDVTDHEFTFDAAQRMTVATPPVLTLVPVPATTYTYDDDHKLELITRPDGKTIDFVYDLPTDVVKKGRLTKITTPHGDYTLAYETAPQGRLDSITGPAGRGQLVYTAGYDGSLPYYEQFKDGNTVFGTVSWAYDNNFRRRKETVSGSTAVDILYNGDGALTTVGALTLVPDAVTGWTKTTTLGTATSSAGYDKFGGLESLAYKHGTTSVYNASYTRDLGGRVKTRTEVRLVAPSGSRTIERCYTYDAAGRLWKVHNGTAVDAVTKECMATVLEEYRYGVNSNRVYAKYGSGVVVDETANAAAYDEQDRLVEYGGVKFGYTANGELDLKENTATSPSQVWDFEYDVFGNLTKAVLPNNDKIDYLLDPRSRRVGKKKNDVVVQRFLYGSQLAPVAELNAANQVVSRFVYATRINVPDYMERGGKQYRFVTDHLGSVVAVLRVDTGAVVQELEYDAWGNVTSEVVSEAGFSQPFGFAGGLWDRDTGLVRFGARDYDPWTGRWTAKDPIGFAGGDANLYGYVLGDPVNGFDPWGLWRIPGVSTPGMPFKLPFGPDRDSHANRNQQNRCPKREPNMCGGDMNEDFSWAVGKWRGSAGSECTYDRFGDLKPDPEQTYNMEPEPWTLDHVWDDVVAHYWYGGNDGYSGSYTMPY